MGKSIKHEGVKRRSGRYPWGSGEDPQRSQGILGRIEELRSQGLSETETAKALNMTTRKMRAKIQFESARKRQADAAFALRLKDKGWSNTAIGERMNINESSVRSLLDPAKMERAKKKTATLDTLKESIEKQELVDIGVGVERHLGVSRTNLKNAVSELEDEGYPVHRVYIKQPGTGKMTTFLVASKKGMDIKEVYDRKDEISMPASYSENKGLTFDMIEKPRSVSSSRVKVVYDEDGGTKKDGLIELRRGKEDISLGNSRYAQVRIAVDDTHYIKGMAVYSDDLPPGVDIQFNTNKKRGTPKISKNGKSVLKKMDDDPEDPFGSTVRQKHYIDKNGKKQLSALNIVNEEGDWYNWSDKLSSQFLSKQQKTFVKERLDETYKIKKQEYDEIMSLTNPVIKKKLLQTYSDNVDSASAHLKAAGMPRQKNHVILPFDIKENEVYAPQYKNGEHVVLVRHPHGGKFEIPELVVNNKNKGPRDVIGFAKDAIGINHKVAERLSGADFDGDTVLVIPNDHKKVKTQPPLKKLKDFDPKEYYPGYKGMNKMSEHSKGVEMGKISNLITDMTIKGATNNELAAAVRHSMVVIDAYKHGLNYKQSELDNNISNLRERYQDGGGASTLVSRSNSTTRIAKRKAGKRVTDPKTGKTKTLYIDPATGKKLYTETGEEYVNSKGKVIKKLEKSKGMYDVDDAHKLSSGTQVESIYADYANDLKKLANNARKEMINTPNLEYSPSAKKTYAKEVDSLNAKLNLALKNAPLERKAVAVADSRVAAKIKSKPDLDSDDVKKLKFYELNKARAKFGAGKNLVDITEKEWEAIQAGAISNNQLTKIVNNSDIDKIKTLATPRSKATVTSAKRSRIDSMVGSGKYTQAEIAEAAGVSVSTLNKILEE